MAENENIVFAKELRLRNDAELSPLLQSKSGRRTLGGGVKFSIHAGSVDFDARDQVSVIDSADKTVLHE
ncbi:MAG: hypothetical protein R3C68_12980 [Myxococcota bacterium]